MPPCPFTQQALSIITIRVQLSILAMVSFGRVMVPRRTTSTTATQRLSMDRLDIQCGILP
jgi:hypothetical protein